MNTKITLAGHLAITGTFIAIITVVMPTFLATLIPNALWALLASRQIQIEWLHSLLQAMG